MIPSLAFLRWLLFLAVLLLTLEALVSCEWLLLVVLHLALGLGGANWMLLDWLNGEDELSALLFLIAEFFSASFSESMPLEGAVLRLDDVLVSDISSVNIEFGVSHPAISSSNSLSFSV